MSVTAIYGKQRRGKSLFSCYYALWLAEEYHKPIVSNFPFKLDFLFQYCYYCRYSWLLNNFDRGVFKFIKCSSTEDLIKLFSIENTVILADEMAVYLPARGSSYNTPVALREALVQVGHSFQHFIYIAQNQEQVDSALRSQCEEIYHCSGQLKYSKSIKNDALIVKSIRRFEPDSYQIYLSDPKIRRNPVKLKLLSTKHYFGVPTCSDYFLFNCYDSFTKLSRQSAISSAKYLRINDYLWESSSSSSDSGSIASPFFSWLFQFLPYALFDSLCRFEQYSRSFLGFSSLEKFIIQVVFCFFFAFLFGIFGGFCAYFSLSFVVLLFYFSISSFRSCR